MSVFNFLNEVIHVYTHKMFKQFACNLICLKIFDPENILSNFQYEQYQQKVSKISNCQYQQ